MSTTSHVNCTVEYDDWIEIAESEFVDYAEGTDSIGLIFEHEEYGLHGLKFDPSTGVLQAVQFAKHT